MATMKYLIEGKKNLDYDKNQSNNYGLSDATSLMHM